MVWKAVIFVIIFYFLALLQVSFLGYFGLGGFGLNLLLIGVVLINLFFPDPYLGFLSALTGGFFWDVFSSQIFGFHVLILVGIAALVNFVFKRYVQSPLS